MWRDFAKAVNNHAAVKYVAFSSADEALLGGFPAGTLKDELLTATSGLGIPSENVQRLRYKVSNFTPRRHEILEDMLNLRGSFDPDIVLVPSLNDLHQDHRTVAEECRRMFKMTSVLGYGVPWKNISFDTLAFSVLDETQVSKKIDALLCYKSQMHRDYLNADFIRSPATTRGVQIAASFAEAFEVIRWIMR